MTEILYPEEKKVTSYSETYLISCMAEPGTEITLYERYDDTLFVPLTVNNEAITGTVGESGLYLIEMTFRPNSTNRIMFFAQKGKIRLNGESAKYGTAILRTLKKAAVSFKGNQRFNNQQYNIATNPYQQKEIPTNGKNLSIIAK